ncbi:MAG: hypothetical protein LH606_17325 [Cytophagaceae bacterium]|nr:hypothetical protein [Cytophagaceae bacterium]
MIRPGSTSISNQPGDQPPLPSERGSTQANENVILGAETSDTTPNTTSDVTDGEEKVPERDHDQDDKLGGTEQSELHNISVREMKKADENEDGRPMSNR